MPGFKETLREPPSQIEGVSVLQSGISVAKPPRKFSDQFQKRFGLALER